MGLDHMSANSHAPVLPGPQSVTTVGDMAQRGAVKVDEVTGWALASLREEASRAQTCPGRTMRGRRERAAAYVPRSEASGEPAAADPGTEAAQAHGQARPSPPCSASSATQDGSVNAGLGVVCRPKRNTPFGPAVVGRGRGRGFTRSPGHLLSVGWPQEGRVS